MRRVLVPLLVALLVPTVAGAAPPEPTNFGAHLTGADEVPARETDATGQATYRILGNGDVMWILTVANIENVFAAHIHCGDTDDIGPVVVPLFEGPPGGGRTQGVLSTGTFDPDGLTCTFAMTTVPLIDAMRAQLTYTNVHTNDGDATPNEGAGDFPGGEIRGQNLVRGPQQPDPQPT
jgi:CHRD domain